MIECFKLQLLQFESSRDCFDLHSGKELLKIRCLEPPFFINPITIVADPFLFVHDSRLYLFYESKRWQSPGVIKMVSTTDLKKWTKPVVVLKEPFHLSFPWVFKENEKVYMIPETSGDSSIRLYEATNDNLTSFSFKKKLIVDDNPQEWRCSFVDSFVVKKEGSYFLFTSRLRKDKTNVLELYTSDKMDGDYKPHLCSPIFISNKVGRNAGCVIDINDSLLRFSQDCCKRYGDNVHISKITKLNRKEYEEQLVKENIIPLDIPFFRDGGHQFSIVNYGGKYIVATDAKEYHNLLLNRALYKLLRCVHLEKLVYKK